jgi:kynurenine formamidase
MAVQSRRNEASEEADVGELIDLSLAIEDGMPAHALFPSPLILRHRSHEQSRELGLGTPEDPWSFATNYISMLDHVGTHVDAPLHVAPDGIPIDQVPLEWFTGPAVCLDLRDTPDLGDIDVADLEAAEQVSGVRIDGHIVLLCTGFHARHWPDPEVVRSNPGLTAEATHWLADHHSRLHGVEGPSTDKAGTTHFASHRVCRDRGIGHYEWLVGLERLLGRGEFRFTGFPLRWVGGTGSPVRAVAEIG